METMERTAAVHTRQQCSLPALPREALVVPPREQWENNGISDMREKKN